MTTVSLIVPVYNVEPWIERFLASVAVQTLRDLEVVVVDDAATDGSLAHVRRAAAADPRFRITVQERNGGPALARERGVGLATGEWLAFVDPDDELEPDRLERMLAAAQELRADWIADDQLIRVDGAARPLGRLLVDEPPRASLVGIAHLIDRDLPGSIGYGTLKPMVRRGFLLDRGVRYPTVMNRCDDFLFQVACGTAGARMALLNEPLYRYRLRPGSEVTGLSPAATSERLRQASVEAMAMARRAGDAGSIRALAARARAIDHHAAYSRIVESFRAGDRVEALRALISAPGAWPHGLGRLRHALVRRLRGQENALGNLGSV